MPILAIETSNTTSMAPHAAAIAIANPDQPARPLATAALADAEHAGVAHAISHALDAAGLRAADLTAIAVSTGPGGYTATRTAAATAAALALAAGIPAIPVPTHDALAHAHASDRQLAIALAWKRDSLFLAVYEPGITSPKHAALTDIRQLPELTDHSLVADPRLATALRDAGSIPTDLATEAPRLDANAVLAVAVQRTPVHARELQPLYPRQPEAVSNWRKRQAH
jgi:tRNA threonylcarbamoyl adenosine modification protein YeaZ